MFFFCLAITAAAATAPSAQSPVTGTLKQWDVFAATGGNGAATQNVTAVVVDNTGISGVAGSAWLTAQNPSARVGRVDPASPSLNYIEWRPVETDQGGAPLGLALNTGNGDLWMSIQGDPSFVIKLGGAGNTFRKFRADYALSPEGIVIGGDNAAVAALPFKSALGLGDAVAKIPRNPTNGSVTFTYWPVGGEPHHVALDGSGNIWFTEKVGNKVGRLNPVTGVVTEWALPAGSSPMGLHVSGPRVCVASSGQIGALNGVAQCLDTATNQMTRFARATGDGFDLPQQVAANGSGELFMTEQNGSAISFVAYAARTDAVVTSVAPTTRTVAPKTSGMYVSDVTVTPTTYTAAATTTTLTGADNGGGYLRFPLPKPALTYPSEQTGYPQPLAITPVMNDFGQGSGTVFVTEYFDGGVAGRQPAGRLDRFEVVGPPVAKAIVANPSSLNFNAVIGSAAPATQMVAITEASGQPLAWTATKTASWLTVSPSSGSAPSTLTIAVNHASLAAGTYTDTITVDDGADGADPRTIAVSLAVAAKPTISVTPGSLSFAATVGSPPPSQSLAITNTGGGVLDWTATASDTWIHLSQASGTAPSTFSVSVDLPGNQSTKTGTITIASASATNPSISVPLTLTVSQTPPQISATPSSMTFNAVRTGPAPASQTLTISNTGGGTLTWTAGGTEPWISLSPASANTVAGSSAAVTVTVNQDGMPRGTYSGQISIADPTASNSPKYIPITLNVTAPVIGTAPSSLTFTAVQGSSPASQTVTVSNSGDGPLTFTPSVATTSGGNWLAVSPAASVTVAAGASTTLTLSASSATLTPGSYGASLTISDLAAANNPQSVPVSLTVNASGVITMAPASLAVTSVKGSANPAPVTATIGNSGGVPFTYATSVTAGGTWLSIASGGAGTVAPSESAALTVAIDASALSKGTYTGTVQVSSSEATNSPTTITVTLTVQAPTIGTSASSLTFGVLRTRIPSAQTFTVSNSGDATLNFVSSTTGSGWLSVAPGSGSLAPGASTTLTASVASSTLATGSYSGSIQIIDANASNSPKAVPVTLTVSPAPTVAVGPASLGFTMGQGGTSTQSLTVTNTGDAVLTFTSQVGTSGGGNWLSVAPAGSLSVAAGGSASLAAAVNTNGMTAGNYSGTITIADPNSTNGGQVVPVLLTVTTQILKPMISLSAASLSFSGTRRAVCNGVAGGSNPANQSVTLTNTGNATLNFSVAASSTGLWLSASPSSGSLAPGSSTTVVVAADTLNSLQGNYSGSITVSDPNSSNGSQTVPVALSLGAAPATLCVTPMSMNFGTFKRNTTSPSQTFTVTNVGDLSMGAWSATRSASSGTINMSVTSGVAPTTVTVSVKASTKAGAQTGSIIVSAAGVAGSPRTISLTWTVK